MGYKTSGGCLLCADRSKAETLDPWGACHTTTETLRKMGCKTSWGRLFCNDRSGAETE